MTEPPDSRRASRWRGIASIVGVALVLTISNAVKPLVIDDAALVFYAEQIAKSPTDPYGFEMLWWKTPEPANHILMPPVLPYWYGLAVSAFGDRPLLWKLSLFPILLLLSASLYGILRRFAAGREHPLLWMILLSPAVFPSINLMLDVPALAFGLAAMWTLLVAVERGGLARFVLAGLLAGISMQTKYTGFVWLAALLCLGGVFHRFRQTAIAVAVAVAVFALWEIFTAVRYGESHFLHALFLPDREGPKIPHLWALGFVCLVGALVPGVAALFCAGLGAGRRAGFAFLAIATACFASLALLTGDPVAGVGRSVPNLSSPRPELFVFAPLGVAVLALIVFGVRSQLRLPAEAAERRIDRFLALWFLLETVAFFLISPFLAGRRLIGWIVSLHLLAGRFGMRRNDRPTPRVSGLAPRVSGLANWAVGWSIALGLLFALSDLTDALARREMIGQVERRLDELGADRATQDVWFVGHWGFRYYAELRGMRPLIPGQSRIRAGDWLLLSRGVARTPFALPTVHVERVAQVRVENSWPWSTLPSLYRGPLAIRAQADSQLLVNILRAEASFRASFPK